jgi:hypothetical protein
MAATNYTPIQLYFSTTASAVPLAANLAQGELAINITDGKLYYEDNAGVVQVIATKGAGTIGGSNTQIQYNNAGALAGNAAMTFNSATSTTTLTTLNLTNALGAIYGGTAQSTYAQGDVLYASASNTLAKLGIGAVNYILTSTGSVPQWSAPSSISVLTATNLAGGLAGSVPYQSAVDTTTFLAIGAANRVMTSTGTAPQWVTSLTGLTGVSSSSITNTSLTSGRVVVSTTGGAQADDADLTFDGTTLSAGGFSTVGLTTLVKTVKIGDSSFSGVAVFAPSTPAKLYLGTGTVTDTTSAIGATNATGAIASLAITPIAATNTSVTYTNAATLYIAGAPSAGTNITLTNPYALYVAAGASYFGGAVDFAVTPSYSGGTANGVMYLNGSKQITTGTALTFDGTNLGIGTNSAGTILDVAQDVATAVRNTSYNAVNALTTSSFQVRRARGTAASPSALLSGDSVGIYVFGGATSSSTFANSAAIQALAAENFSSTAAGTDIAFYTAPIGSTTRTERMRIASSTGGVGAVGIGYTSLTSVGDSGLAVLGNVGIGTNSPAAKLNTSIAAGSASATNIHYLLSETGTNSDTGLQIKAVNSTNSWDAGSITFRREGAANSYGLKFATSSGGSNTDRATLTSTGTLGVGNFIPYNTWGNSYVAIQVANSSRSLAATGAGSGDLTLVFNGVYDSTDSRWEYAGTGDAAVRYSQTGAGIHAWFNAPVGTAGNAISFNQAMTLDASGRLGVGVTSPQFRLDVFRGSSGVVLNLDGENAYNAETGITLSSQRAKISGFLESSGGTPGSILRFYTMPNGGSVTQRMEIASNGQVGIGNITPGQSLDVSGNIRSRDGALVLSIGTVQQGVVCTYNAILGSGSDYTPTIFAETGLGITFAVNGSATKTMSLTSGGNLLVGTTSSAGVARITVNGGSIISTSPTSSASGTYSFSDNGGSPNNFRVYNDTDSNNTGNRFIICDAGASVLRAEIRSNGGLANYQANNVNLSDRREKTNFAPAKSYLNVICAIPVQTFNYIDQNMEEDGGLTLGVVAQDVQAVAPELVMESNWAGRDSEPKMRLSIYQTDLQYALMKCIQEQQAIIESLKARLDAANL